MTRMTGSLSPTQRMVRHTTLTALLAACLVLILCGIVSNTRASDCGSKKFRTHRHAKAQLGPFMAMPIVLTNAASQIATINYSFKPIICAYAQKTA